MYKKTIGFALFMLTLNYIYACDICGCFMGITPYDNQSSIAFLHRYRSFNGYRLYNQQPYYFPDATFKSSTPQSVYHGGSGNASNLQTYSAKDYEVYKVYELRAKYFIHNRVELNAYAPINQNSSLTNNEKSSHTGMGDITLFAGYHLIKKVNYEKYLQRLIVGAGIKIPTGSNSIKGDDGDRIPLLMQPGTGGVDCFTYLNYIGGIGKFAFSFNCLYKLNSENNYHERIANSTSNYLNLFYKIKMENWVIMPSVQGYYEFTKGLYINHQLQQNTGMNVLLIGPGLDTYYKNVGINCAFQFKAWEKNSLDNLSSAGRLVLGVSYNFNQKKYLLKNKTL